MTITPAVLQRGVVLGTASAAIYTTPAGTSTVVKRAVATNVGAAAATVTVSLTRSGGAALVIVPARSLAIGGTDTLPELANLVLAAGDVVSALAGTAASINLVASGYTVV